MDAAVGGDAAPDAALSPGDPFAAFAAQPPVCGSAGWCWQWPTPAGTAYHGIAHSSPTNIWILGGGPPSYAAILQWDGQKWTAHHPPEPTCKSGVPCGYSDYLFPLGLATTSSSNAWLIYTNLLEHWDGTSWTIVYELDGGNVSLNGLWLDPAGDPWVTRSDGTIDQFHPDTGLVTTLSTSVYAGAIWGTADDDVFVSSIGAVLHYDGNAFSVIYQGETLSVYQGVRNDVWLSGTAGTIAHWDGSAVTVLDSGITEPEAFVSAGEYAGPGDASWISTGASLAPSYFVHWDGTQLATTPIEPATTALGDSECAGLGAAQIIDGKWWLVCREGAVATRSGPSTIRSIVDELDAPAAMWGASRDDLYVANGGDLRHWDGSAWTTQAMPIATIDGVAGAGADELFGVAESYDGATSSYATTFEHFDGSAWTATPLSTWIYQVTPFEEITQIRALGPGEAFAIGGNGAVFHYQGGQVTRLASGTTATLEGIWGPDADHLWISGTNGTLLQWDRSAPLALVPDATFPATTEELGEMAGADDTAWIVAPNQLHVWKHTTTGWQQVAVPVIPVQIAATSATDVVVTSTDSGLLARWSGSAFAIEAYPNWLGNNHIASLPDGSMYLLGQSGILEHP